MVMQYPNVPDHEDCETCRILDRRLAFAIHHDTDRQVREARLEHLGVERHTFKVTFEYTDTVTTWGNETEAREAAWQWANDKSERYGEAVEVAWTMGDDE